MNIISQYNRGENQPTYFKLESPANAQDVTVNYLTDDSVKAKAQSTLFDKEFLS